MEWAVLFNGIEKVIVLVIGLVGYLIRRSLNHQADVNDRSSEKLDKILTQVTITNGRVGVLEQWKADHIREVDMTNKGTNEKVKALSDRVDRVIDRT